MSPSSGWAKRIGRDAFSDHLGMTATSWNFGAPFGEDVGAVSAKSHQPPAHIRPSPRRRRPEPHQYTLPAPPPMCVMPLAPLPKRRRSASLGSFIAITTGADDLIRWTRLSAGDQMPAGALKKKIDRCRRKGVDGVGFPPPKDAATISSLEYGLPNCIICLPRCICSVVISIGAFRRLETEWNDTMRQRCYHDCESTVFRPKKACNEVVLWFFEPGC